MSNRDARSILRERALALASADDASARGEVIEVVEFRLADERYAIEHQYVSEVTTLAELTRVPGTPEFIRGIMNWRGQILPLLDIKTFFDLPLTGIVDLHSTLVIQAGGIELGILADAIAGVAGIAVEHIQPSLPTLTGIRAQYLKGITPDHVVILDARQIVSDPRLVVDQGAGT